MKNSLLLPLAIAAAISLAGCSLSKSKAVEPEPVKPIPVTVTEAKFGRITAAQPASGQIEPVLSISVTAKIPGRVVAVHRSMGETVKAGDLLAVLEDRDAVAQVAQAKASLLQAEAHRDETDRQLHRLTSLLEVGAVSRQQVEQLQTSLALARAQVAAAQAAVDLAQANLERTRITAPSTGILAARSVEPGTLVGTGTTLFQLVDLSTVVVKASVAERDVNSVSPGTEVPVSVPALGQEFSGTVEAVSPIIDRQTRAYQVRVALPNPKASLKGGMFAQVRFPARPQEGVVLPVGAVVERNGQTVVYVAEGDAVRAQPVTVTASADGMVTVEGVTPGNLVVTAGQTQLYDGARVVVGGKNP